MSFTSQIPQRHSCPGNLQSQFPSYVVEEPGEFNPVEGGYHSATHFPASEQHPFQEDPTQKYPTILPQGHLENPNFSQASDTINGVFGARSSEYNFEEELRNLKGKALVKRLHRGLAAGNTLNVAQTNGNVVDLKANNNLLTKLQSFGPNFNAVEFKETINALMKENGLKSITICYTNQNQKKEVFTLYRQRTNRFHFRMFGKSKDDANFKYLAHNLCNEHNLPILNTTKLSNFFSYAQGSQTQINGYEAVINQCFWPWYNLIKLNTNVMGITNQQNKDPRAISFD